MEVSCCMDVPWAQLLWIAGPTNVGTLRAAHLIQSGRLLLFLLLFELEILAIIAGGLRACTFFSTTIHEWRMYIWKLPK